VACLDSQQLKMTPGDACNMHVYHGYFIQL